MRLTGQNRTLHGGPEGEVVYGVEVSDRANDPATLGAFVATCPMEEGDAAEPIRLISAVGNGELWVVDSGCDLQPGDLLISSAVPGCVMKDDPEQFPIGHIVARAAQEVRWGEVTRGADGIRRAKVSVLFDPFTRGPGYHEIRGLNERMSQKESEIADLRQELREIKQLLQQFMELD
jgi:hypothetical protein